jgi:glycosyltransferase involved in cell wall biosynthesis
MSKKVLHLRSSGGVLGAESVVIELGKHTNEFGYQSFIGALKNRDDPFPEFIKVAQESKIETVIFEGRHSFDITLIRDIKNFILQNNVDILHCHGYKEDFYGIFTPVSIPRVATNHLWKRTTTRLKLYSMIDAIILRYFNLVIGVSDEIVNEMQSYNIRTALKIPNGVDIDKFSIRHKSFDLYDKIGFKPDDFIVGMISSLSPEKGHIYAINAMRNLVGEFPNIRLLIIGDGALKSEIQEQIITAGIQGNVELVGNQKNIPEFLSIIDVFIMPSLKEGLPIALLEAMASGKAVIATRVGENENVIEDGKTGFLIDPDNSKQLEEAILKLVRNKEIIAKLGSNARMVVENQYSSQIMCKKYCEQYENVLKR